MTDQELRRLSRADLIDIIYTLQQQKEQAEQQHENQTAFHDAFLLIFLPVYHSFSLKSLNFS